MIKILLVEDNENHACLVERLLDRVAAGEFMVEWVTELSDAISRLYTKSFDVVLLDLSLPDAQGLLGLRTLHSTGTDVPIVVLTATDDQSVALKAVQNGAQDYLVKDFRDGDSIVRGVRYAIERKHYEERLVHRAHFDHLTGLANRALFLDRLEHSVARARRANTWMSLMYLDLDRFKTINDTLGHAVGDRLLQEIASRLKDCVREADMVARLGGDEFTVIIEGPGQRSDVDTVAKKVLTAIRPAYYVDEHEIYVSCSIGIAVFPECGADMKTLTRNADTAMYQAKARGGDTHEYFTVDMSSRALHRLELEARLRKALEGGELCLVYQPRVDLHTGRIVGLESLLRWPGHLGEIEPDEFLHLAEESGLIASIGEWVIRTVCSQLGEWQAAGVPVVPVSVNLSGRQCWQSALVTLAREVLEATRVPAGLLELEIAESLLMEDRRNCEVVLRKLEELGVRLGIDAFGTGYSALRCLKRLPLDFIKIDRSLVRGVSHDANDATITKAIVALAHRCGLEAVAEGVETEEQRSFLHDARCDAGQGLLFWPSLDSEATAGALVSNASANLDRSTPSP